MDDMLAEALELRGLSFYSDLFTGYVRTLIAHGATELVDDLATLLNTEEHITNADLIDKLRNFVQTAQEQLLQQHGIVMELSCLAERDDVLETLLQIQHTDEAVVYATIIESYEDPILVLCDIVAHAQGTTSDNYLPHIVAVNDSLWDRCYQLLMMQITDLPETPKPIDAERKLKVKQYYETYNNPVTEGYSNQAFQYGEMPDSILKKIDLAYQDMNSRSPETPKWIAENIYGVLLFSGTRLEKFMEVGRLVIDEHVIEPALSMSSQSAFSQLCIRGGKRAST